MPKPNKNDARRARTRTKLLDAAARAFVSNGYHKTRISEIVRMARVGQGTFYRYFTDKRDAFERLTEVVFERMFAEFMTISDEMPTNVAEYHDRSMAAVKRAAEMAETNLPLMQLILREGPAIDREFEARLDEMFNRFADLARYYLDNAIKGGFARPCNSAVVSQALVGMTLRLLETGWGESGALHELPKEKLIEEAVDFAFRGFGLFEQPAGALPPKAK